MSEYDFIETLNELDGGVFLQKISQAVKSVAGGVVDQGRKGKVTVELSFSRIGESAQVEMKHKLKYDRPTLRGNVIEADETSTPLWVGSRGLSIMPQEQGGFDFSEKGAGRG